MFTRFQQFRRNRGTRGLRFAPIRAKSDYDRAIAWITEEVTDPSHITTQLTFPISEAPHLYFELIGAWDKERLVGVVFVGPDIQHAYDWKIVQDPAHDPEIIMTSVAVVQGIFVEREYRRRGIALRLKEEAYAWAYKHGAHFIISFPITEASQRLNERAGYHLTQPDVFLVYEYLATGRAEIFPYHGNTVIAMKRIPQPGRPTPILLYEETTIEGYTTTPHDLP